MTGVSASAKYIKVMSLFTPGQPQMRSRDDAHHEAHELKLRSYNDVTLFSASSRCFVRKIHRWWASPYFCRCVIVVMSICDSITAERRLDLGEYPLEVQLNWTKDEKEGKFVLRNAAHKPINVQKVTSCKPSDKSPADPDSPEENL